MKQKYVALKMYLIGITLGLFVWVWSGVTHLDATQSNSISQTAASTTTVQTRSTSQQSSFAQPRVRTRTS
jgi:hypothetical protein